MEFPPYTAEEMIDFYGDGRFTHGCSIDHVIFDFIEDDHENDLEQGNLEENRRRFEITSTNAEDFLKQSRRLGNSFTPVGRRTGLVSKIHGRGISAPPEDGISLHCNRWDGPPFGAPKILKALREIRVAVGNDLSLHILGFAKAEEIGEFSNLNITSIDTTSPLIRAFKDSDRNYYALKPEGGIKYYSAIRIPQSIENNGLKNLAKRGAYSQEDLQSREKLALQNCEGRMTGGKPKQWTRLML